MVCVDGLWICLVVFCFELLVCFGMCLGFGVLCGFMFGRRCFRVLGIWVYDACAIEVGV